MGLLSSIPLDNMSAMWIDMRAEMARATGRAVLGLLDADKGEGKERERERDVDGKEEEGREEDGEEQDEEGQEVEDMYMCREVYGAPAHAASDDDEEEEDEEEERGAKRRRRTRRRPQETHGLSSGAALHAAATSFRMLPFPCPLAL